MKDKNFYKKSIKQCLAEYDSSLDGLSSVQVENRIAESKLYSIKPQKKQSLFAIMFRATAFTFYGSWLLSTANCSQFKEIKNIFPCEELSLIFVRM